MTDASRAQLIEAMLPHVPFDGFSDVAFDAAVADLGITPGHARALFARGGVDVAKALHLQGDQMMLDRMAETDMNALKYREKIAAMVRFRLEAAGDAEVIRRATSLFALPQYASEGSALLWGTSDAIWTALGDTSRDINWYSKRATLSAVYASTLLFWLGDESEDHADTWAFLDRRIENVMQFERLKSGVRKNPLLSAALAGPAWLLSQVKAPEDETNLPGAPRRQP